MPPPQPPKSPAQIQAEEIFKNSGFKNLADFVDFGGKTGIERGLLGTPKPPAPGEPGGPPLPPPSLSNIFKQGGAAFEAATNLAKSISDLGFDPNNVFDEISRRAEGAPQRAEKIFNTLNDLPNVIVKDPFTGETIFDPRAGRRTNNGVTQVFDPLSGGFITVKSTVKEKPTQSFIPNTIQLSPGQGFNPEIGIFQNIGGVTTPLGLGVGGVFSNSGVIPAPSVPSQPSLPPVLTEDSVKEFLGLTRRNPTINDFFNTPFRFRSNPFNFSPFSFNPFSLGIGFGNPFVFGSLNPFFDPFFGGLFNSFQSDDPLGLGIG